MTPARAAAKEVKAFTPLSVGTASRHSHQGMFTSVTLKELCHEIHKNSTVGTVTVK